MRVYLSMPLTNGGTNTEHARAVCVFDALAMAEVLRSWGYDVVVPHTMIAPEVERLAISKLGKVKGSKAMLQLVASHIPDCDTVVIAGQWDRSAGCMYEIQLANMLEVPVMSADALYAEVVV